MRSYTEKQRKKILVLLKIEPGADGWIDAEQAAEILSYRALTEYGVHHCYSARSIAQMVYDHKITVAVSLGPRRRRYDPRVVFSVAITPGRGRRKEETCPSKASTSKT